jgi:hypothetical protein
MVHAIHTVHLFGATIFSQLFSLFTVSDSTLCHESTLLNKNSKVLMLASISCAFGS